MTNGRKDGADLFLFFYGKTSPLNLPGKIFFFPIIGFMALVVLLLEVLFTKPK